MSKRQWEKNRAEGDPKSLSVLELLDPGYKIPSFNIFK